MLRPSLIATSLLLLSTHTALAQLPTKENADKSAQSGSSIHTDETVVLTDADIRALEPVIRQYILDHPEVIHQSLYDFQQKQALKEEEEKKQNVVKYRDSIYHSPHDAFVGPRDSKKVVVEFFDYNCGACKHMHSELKSFLSIHKDVKVIFKEYPIFGETSVENARFGLAVQRLHPDKYFDFHSKMLEFEGRASLNQAVEFADSLGMNVEKLRDEANKPEVLEILEENRALAQNLGVEGTPSLVIKDELIGSAIDKETLNEKLNGNTPPAE